jgi:putative transposase
MIVAPKWGVGRMLQREDVLSAGTRETMRFQRHGLFNQRLRIKAEACGKVVLDLEEHGSSKTCRSCGQANRGSGANKVFKCGRCGHEEDRDVNSAKNQALVGVREY